MTTTIAFDFESYPIAPGRQFPPAVCMSYAVVVGSAEAGDLRIAHSDVVPYYDGVRMLREWGALGYHFVGANSAFDLFEAAYNSSDVVEYVQWIIRTVNASAITDVLLRQRLLDGAVDKFRRLHRYGLDAVTEHWTGVKLDKSNPWRLLFGTLDGIHPNAYPPEARQYSLDDAWYTALVYIAQEYARIGYVSEQNGVKYRERFPNHDPLLDEHRQLCRAIALKDLEAVGLHTNARSVAEFRKDLEAERDILREQLVANGLVRKEIKRNTAGIVAAFEAQGLQVPLSPTGKPSITKKLYGQVLDTTHELHLTYGAAFAEYAEYLADAFPSLVTVTFTKNTEAAKELLIKAFESQPADALKRTDAGAVKLDNDACTRSKHPLLVSYARYSSLEKTLGTDFKLLEEAAHAPFHAHYTTLRDNGRSSTGSDKGEGTPGNVQNMPRTPGVRECYQAPAGWLIAEADFSAVELSTFGQVCLWFLGWSECARMIQEGVDQHSVMGAALLGLADPKGAGWRELKARKKAGDSAADDARTGGKGMNFGCKARMGAKRYKDYAWNNYGLDLTLDECQRHINLHNSMIAEMDRFTELCESFARNPGQFKSRYDLVHPWSGRLRADLGYTDVHNYQFSGLAQDLATVALWDLFCAKWGMSELGVNDPFYGCLPCLFVHDSIAAYVPDDARAHERATRLGEIMTRAARKVLPDVGSLAEPQLQRQLSKKAEPVTGPDGRLMPWDAWEQCAKDLGKRKQDDAKAPEQWLLDRGWPRFVVRDTLTERRET